MCRAFLGFEAILQQENIEVTDAEVGSNKCQCYEALVSIAGHTWRVDPEPACACNR